MRKKILRRTAAMSDKKENTRVKATAKPQKPSSPLEFIIKIYKSYEIYFKMLVKFLFGMLIFRYITNNLGYYSLFNGTPMHVALSAACAVVPSSIYVLIVALVVLLHMFKLSLAMAALAAIFFLVFYFLYLKFAPEHGLMTIAVPVLMPYGLHFIVPFAGGLMYNPFTIVPSCVSFVFIKGIKYMKEAAAAITGEFDFEGIVKAYKQVFDKLLDDKELQLFIIAFIVIIVVTFIVTHLPFNYSWYIGLLAGAIAGIIVFVAGGRKLGVDVSTSSVVIGSLISMLIVGAVQFLFHGVEYSKREFVQFEDDEYFYYVKALPKKFNTEVPESPYERRIRERGEARDAAKERKRQARLDRARGIKRPAEEEDADLNAELAAERAARKAEKAERRAEKAAKRDEKIAKRRAERALRAEKAERTDDYYDYDEEEEAPAKPRIPVKKHITNKTPIEANDEQSAKKKDFLGGFSEDGYDSTDDYEDYE